MKKKEKKRSRIKSLNIIVVIMTIIVSLNVFAVCIRSPLNAEAEDNTIYVPDTPVIDLSKEVPKFTNGTDCFIYAEQLLINSKGVESTVTGDLHTDMQIPGTGKPIVKQNFNNKRYTDNNGVKYSTSISLKDGNAIAGKNNYQQVVYDINGSKKIYKRVSDSPNYPSNWECYSENDYAVLCGGVPGTLMYIINQDTVVRENYFKVDETSKTYSFKLTLNPTQSTLNYRRLVKNSGGLSSYPSFKNITVTCVVDFDGKFKSMISDEKYSCDYIISGVVMYAHYDEQFKCIGGDVSAPFEHNQF